MIVRERIAQSDDLQPLEGEHMPPPPFNDVQPQPLKSCSDPPSYQEAVTVMKGQVSQSEPR